LNFSRSRQPRRIRWDNSSGFTVSSLQLELPLPIIVMARPSAAIRGPAPASF